MRVLYLLRYFPALTESFVRLEIDGVAERGIEVAVASLGTRADSPLAPPLRAGVPVLRVPRRSLAGLLARPTAGMRWLAGRQRDRDARRLPWLARRARDFDRVHVHFAGEAAEFARALRLDLGIPYTVTVHARDLFQPRPSLAEVLRDADAVLAVARPHLERIAALGVRARLVRCGPRLDDWAALPPPPPGPLRALCVARPVPKKGLDVLLEAWRRLGDPGARLELVGSADDGGVPGVRALGPLPPDGVRAALARANLVVLAARVAPDGDMDGVPVALMEALAAGRPVVSTAVSGIPELVDDEVGWLVPPEDPDALAAALAAATPAERARRGARGAVRLRERRFTIDAQVRGVLEAWGVSGSSLAGGAGPVA